jgi:Der1-like family
VQYVLLEDWVSYFPSLVITVVYIWSQKNRDTLVRFLFGIQFRALYFPWALILLDVIQGQALMPLLAGLIFGHLYYVCRFLIPLHPEPSISRLSWLTNAPSWFSRLLHSSSAQPASFSGGSQRLSSSSSGNSIRTSNSATSSWTALSGATSSGYKLGTAAQR